MRQNDKFRIKCRFFEVEAAGKWGVTICGGIALAVLVFHYLTT